MMFASLRANIRARLETAWTGSTIAEIDTGKPHRGTWAQAYRQALEPLGA